MNMFYAFQRQKKIQMAKKQVNDKINEIKN